MTIKMKIISLNSKGKGENSFLDFFSLYNYMGFVSYILFYFLIVFSFIFFKGFLKLISFFLAYYFSRSYLFIYFFESFLER